MSRKSIAEAIGLVAVVASLGFVGLEIRQNTRMARAAAYQSIGIAASDAWLSLAYDDDAVRRYYVTPLDSLNASEWL